MTTLHRVTGPAGTEIYSGEFFTDEQAKAAYINEHGEEPTGPVQSHRFDVATRKDLKGFINFGC